MEQRNLKKLLVIKKAIINSNKKLKDVERTEIVTVLVRKQYDFYYVDCNAVVTQNNKLLKTRNYNN